MALLQYVQSIAGGMEKLMKRLIIVGSPRASGRSAHLAETLFEANIDEHPEDELFLVPLSEIEVGPCIACDACREKSPIILKDDNGREVTVERHRCIFDDDMQTLYDLLDDADEVSVVSPIYFSGAPAQLKCLLDRLQPYYWASNRGHAPEKRPATLHVIGEGADPHGHEALVSEVRSALAVAGFRLERVLDWVGKINSRGEITEDAKETLFDASGKRKRPKLDLSSSSAAAGADDLARPDAEPDVRARDKSPSRSGDNHTGIDSKGHRTPRGASPKGRGSSGGAGNSSGNRNARNASNSKGSTRKGKRHGS